MERESELIARAKGGDQRAFEALVLKYEKKVYNMGLRYTGSAEDALDICQEVFLRIFRFIGGFGGQSQFSTWVYRITSNVCKDVLAGKKRSATVSMELESEGEDFEAEIADLRFSPESELDRVELRESIARAISELPEKYREIVILRDINGLTYDEIGHILGLEEGTVKSRIARARERLRRALIQGGNISRQGQSKPVKGGRET